MKNQQQDYQSIKTFEDACAAKGYDPKTILPDLSCFPVQHQKAMTTVLQLVIIQEAVNGDWKPDWTDGKQQKWYPWFFMGGKEGSSGFAFSVTHYYRTDTTAGLGSRLAFASDEIATYVGTKFTDLYKQAFVLE